MLPPDESSFIQFLISFLGLQGVFGGLLPSKNTKTIKMKRDFLLTRANCSGQRLAKTINFHLVNFFTTIYLNRFYQSPIECSV